MKAYFKNDMAIDEDVIGVLEDSIRCNPNLDKEEQNALIADLLYSQPYEVREKETPRYTFFKTNYKQVTSKQIDELQAAPELLDALEDVVTVLRDNPTWDANKIREWVTKHARAAIAKAKGE